jgi:hypothetical protein
MAKQSRVGLVWLLIVPPVLSGCGGSSSTTSVVAITPLITPTAPALTGPRAVVRDRIIDAGGVEYGSPKDYVFPVKNAGDQDLTLELLSRACACAVVTLPPPIPPGQEAQIKVRWAPTPGGPPRFKMSVRTNGPRDTPIALEIKGESNLQVRISPEGKGYLDFDVLQVGRTTEQVLNVYSTKLNQFDLTAAIKHGSEPPAFQAEVRPLDVGSEVDGQKIKSGYSVVVRTANSLPRGHILRDLVLTVSVPGETPREVVLNVYGKVPNGIFTIQPEEEILFTRKNLSEGDEAKVVVQFSVPQPDQTIEVVRCQPSFLVADPPRLVVPGKWLFTLRIPKNDPEAKKLQADEFFEGAVYLKATGSDSLVPVRVKWDALRPGSK